MLPVSPLIGVYICVIGTDGHTCTYSPLSFPCCLLGQPVSVRGILARPYSPPTPVAGVHVYHSDLQALFLT